MSTIRLTDIDIDRLRCYPKAPIRKATYSALGFDPEDMKTTGWMVRMRGKVISRQVYEEALKISKLPRLKHVTGGEAEGQIALF